MFVLSGLEDAEPWKAQDQTPKLHTYHRPNTKGSGCVPAPSPGATVHSAQSIPSGEQHAASCRMWWRLEASPLHVPALAVREDGICRPQFRGAYVHGGTTTGCLRARRRKICIADGV